MAQTSLTACLSVIFWAVMGIVANSNLAIADAGVVHEYNKASNASLLWGPYRSNLYLGVRPRIPQSLLTGLMWYNSDTFDGIRDIRHQCDQADDIDGYGWLQYDPRLGGRQVIRDNGQRVNLTTEFLKNDDGNWILRVSGKPKNALVKTSMVFYAGLEGEGTLDLVSRLTKKGISGDVKLNGFSPDLGEFDITVTEPEGNSHPYSTHDIEKQRPAKNSHYASLRVPDGKVWVAKDIFLTFAQDSVTQLATQYDEQDQVPYWSVFFLQNRDDIKGNLHYVQRTYQGDFQFDIVLNKKGSLNTYKPGDNEQFSSLLKETLVTFDTKFDETFDFKPPFNEEKYKTFGQEMLSNLLGGIGYFHGDALVDRSNAEEYLEDDELFWESAKGKLEDGIKDAVHEGPTELFTCVPSRPFFPRGFYWDEGFHLIPVLDYDPDLAFEVIKSWFDLVDEDGWIAREQILGDEARSRVPNEFVVQYPHYANPPTLMMLFSEIVTKVNNERGSYSGMNKEQSVLGSSGLKLGNFHIENSDLLLSYVKEIYPHLQRHYEWFRRTQKGEIKSWDREAFSSKEAYRWRGRTPSHCLTSGMDDYPRAKVPHTGELHVDLLSWIGMFTRSMKNLAEVLGIEEDIEEYSKREEAIIRNLDDLHWSEEDQAYCDATINEYDDSELVCHKGYVSLLPFLMKLVPASSSHLMPILELVSDPEELWTDYGIASLSKQDEFFGKGEDYWRGSIWMNINYLVLDALKYYHGQPDIGEEEKVLIAKIYSELRKNCVKTVYDNWQKTNFAYEHYDALTGKAVGVKHFLGWTSLVVNMMAMEENL